MSNTGPTAASAAASVATTSSRVRAAHQSIINCSSNSRLVMRPANVENRESPPTPKTSITRAATESLDAETPTHFASLH